MALKDINIIRPVESFQNIVIPQDKKERNKKEDKSKKSAKSKKQELNTSKNNQQATMADNDKHLLDFKA